MRLLTIARDHKRRTSVTLDHAGGSDSDHAAVPTFAVDHDAECVAKSRFFFEVSDDRLQDAALFLLPVAVELIELVGQLTSADWIFDVEQFNDVAGNVHAASGVDARRNTKCNFAG